MSEMDVVELNLDEVLRQKEYESKTVSPLDLRVRTEIFRGSLARFCGS